MAEKIILPLSNVKKKKNSQFGENPVGFGPSNEGIDLAVWIQENIDDGTIDAGGGGTPGSGNLSLGTRTSTTLDVNIDTGTDVTLPAATTTQAGLLSSTDKTKLDGLTNYVAPNHTGDVTSVGDGATTIVNNAVTNAKLADMAGNTVKVRANSTSGDPSDLAIAQGNLVGRGSTGDMTSISIGTGLLMNGSTLESSGGGAYTDQQAQAAVGAIVDGTLQYSSITPVLRRAALQGDVTAPAGSNTTTIAAGVVTNSKLATMSANTIKGNNTGSTGAPVDMTVAQTKTLLAYAGTEVSNTPAGNIAATTVQSAINELDTEKQTKVQYQDEGSNVGTLGGVSTINFTGSGVSASESGGTLTVSISGGGGGSSFTTVTSGSARITYITLSGSPVITFSKSSGVATLGVTGGTIKLIEVFDNLQVADVVSNSIRYDFVGTGANKFDAYPTVTKYTVNSATPTVVNLGDIADQQDTDNTPPALFGDFVLTGQGSMSARTSNITAQIYMKFTWTQK